MYATSASHCPCLHVTSRSVRVLRVTGCLYDLCSIAAVARVAAKLVKPQSVVLRCAERRLRYLFLCMWRTAVYVQSVYGHSHRSQCTDCSGRGTKTAGAEVCSCENDTPSLGQLGYTGPSCNIRGSSIVSLRNQLSASTSQERRSCSLQRCLVLMPMAKT